MIWVQISWFNSYITVYYFYCCYHKHVSGFKPRSFDQVIICCCKFGWLVYRTVHFLCRFLIGWGRSTALTASSNTCLSPLWVSAEHSRYLTARILFANFCPCSRFMGACPLSASACNASLSSRKSIFVPINSIGASGQWCLISGHHLEVTFSKEEGDTTEKQMRNTSVCG